jgi:hypothetical protein
MYSDMKSKLAMAMGFRTLFSGTVLLFVVNIQAQYSDFPFVVISPNGGQVYAVGDTLTAKVGSRSPYSVTMLTMVIGFVGYDFPGQTTQFVAQQDTLHSFVIPTYFKTGNDSISSISNECYIHLADYSIPGNYDESDSAFSILAAPIVITSSPTGPFSSGDSVTVTWRAADRIPGCVIAITADNGLTSTIVSDTITRQSASWANVRFALPASSEGSSALNVMISSIDGSCKTVSASTFSIQEAEKPNRDCGCGSGAGLAFIPLILTRTPLFRRKKK